MNAENVCENCIFWERQGTTPQGQCTSDKFVYSCTDVPDECIRTGVVYWDFECYSAGFHTGEHFGCIHFVAKSEEEK